MLLVFGAVMVPFIIAFLKYDIFMVRLQAYAFKKIILYQKCYSEASIIDLFIILLDNFFHHTKKHQFILTFSARSIFRLYVL